MNQQPGTPIEAISRAVQAISDAISILPIDLRTVLQTIVEHARIVAGAEYAALGIVLDPARPFEPWVYSGVPLGQAAAIGHFPRPVGLLGAVPQEGRTVRLRDLGRDARFRGFPPHHPPMRAFLGVPIQYRGRSVGNLYLANKVGAEEFTEDDQQAVELLATHAGLALQVAGIDELRATVEADRARLETILQSAPHAIIFVEKDTGRIMANPSTGRLFGRTLLPEAGRDQYVGQLLRSDGQPLTLAELPISRALQGQAVSGEELVVVRPDGIRVPVLAGAAPVVSPEEGIVGAVASLQDISALKELERLREEWASLIAHDLRQPVTVIAGFVSLLRRLFKRRAPSEEEARAVEHIGVAASNLNKMIGDLLDISRLEAHRLTLEKRTVDLPSLVRTVVERTAGSTAGHAVQVEVRGEIPPVRIDPGRIEQVLGNLLSNAAKYGYPETEIRVEVQRRNGEVQVSVTNEGPGIPPEELPKLFTRFHRTRQTQQERITGLGLGLYIARGLVEAHGGQIWAESVPGQTTTFHFTLPVAPGAPFPNLA